MSAPTLLAIDQGTTSSRAILFSADGKILATAQTELAQHYPHKGWVEQDARDIWRDTLSVCREIFTTAPAAAQCVAIGITNQRETTILWDRKTGEPVYNAIVWQDRRTADFCAGIKEQHEKSITEKTGLLVDPYFSCSKIRWILDNVDGTRERAERGELAFGTVDTFLLWHLTGGQAHATDATNASRTGLFNIVTQQWDDDLLALYDVPRCLLPVVKDNVALFGETDPALFGKVIPIGGMAGDQQAALIGQGCFTPGMMKSTYGTGCFALMNIGTTFRTSQNRLLTTTAYRLNGQATYAIEGSIFTAGAAVQWLRDNLGVIQTSADSEALAQSVADNNGVYFIPAFTGLGAPHWQPDARAMITGLTRESTKAHIVRAALEAQAYQTNDLLTAMQADTGLFPAILRVDGGLVNNAFVCQFLSDILQVPVELPAIKEATALGAAYLAGLYAGIYPDLETIGKQWQRAKLYEPVIGTEEREKLYTGWTKNLSFLVTSS
ncbi:MAG TPA: glycerol kinase GlpK [Alphaproteobacteria bacterium]